MAQPAKGPLASITVLEMAGLGPVPLAALILAEMGAHVIRIARPGRDRDFLALPEEADLDLHGRDLLRIDLKSADGRALVLDLAARADVLIEGFRPGVMEKLGLGPDECMAANGRLIYARMTGFGQDGPLAQRAGHDLTYLAYTGILDAIGHQGGRPIPPLNLVADYGGGMMLVLFGIVAALFERERSGKGQIVDAAMLDGASMLAAPYFSFIHGGLWTNRRGANLLDSGAPFYDTYETADGKHVAVACLEPQFLAEFCGIIGLEERFIRDQYDISLWPEMRSAIAQRLKAKARDEWAAIFELTDACVAPVLNFKEAQDHPHNRSRGLHVRVDGFVRPAPAPRFSRTPAMTASAPEEANRDARAILDSLGVESERIAALTASGIVAS